MGQWTNMLTVSENKMNSKPALPLHVDKLNEKVVSFTINTDTGGQARTT